MSNPISRRLALQRAVSLGAAGIAAAPVVLAQTTGTPWRAPPMNLAQQWDKTFLQNSRVAHRKVTFKNRYGITLVGDLYQPILLKTRNCPRSPTQSPP